MSAPTSSSTTTDDVVVSLTDINDATTTAVDVISRNNSNNSSSTVATTATTAAPIVVTEDCPICLEAMTASEQFVYRLPCQYCDYNFCSDCVRGFCKSARDDFQMASDGSRQVKVSVACPQCRGRYPMDILDVLLLRQAHALGCSMIKDGRLLNDSDLTASQLTWKHDFFMGKNVRQQLEQAYALYVYYTTEGRTSKPRTTSEQDESRRVVKKEAELVWKDLLEKLSIDDSNEEEEEEEEDYDNNNGENKDNGDAKPKKAKRSPKAKKPSIDETLFHGLEDFMTRDEMIFLTELFTSGNIRCLAQAAMILHGVLRMSMTGRHAAISKQREPPMSKYELQKHLDFIAQTKLSFPVANHMPGYVLIPTYSGRDGFMKLIDQKWDGSISPPPQSKRVFDHVYGQYYKPPQDEYPQQVVTIQSVRGPAGRVGLRKGDVITHVNDIEWKGTAQDLQDYIYECNAQYPQDEISLAVNCNIETATFLKVRHEMIQQQSRERQQKQRHGIK